MGLGYKWYLAREVSDILLLPRRGRSNKSYEIVQAMVQSMTDALQRGEEIRIPGFGIFKLVTQPKRKRSVSYFYGSFRNSKHQTIKVKPRTVVAFKPSKVLLRYINDC